MDYLSELQCIIAWSEESVYVGSLGGGELAVVVVVVLLLLLLLSWLFLLLYYFPKIAII